jgi:hypothetical protein
MTSFILQSFRAGISDYEDKGVAGSFKYGASLDIRKLIDSLSCQQALVDETISGMTDLALFMVVASDGQLYAFCRNGKIFRRTAGGSWGLMYTDTNESGNIIGAAEWYDNAGNTFLLWATPTRLNVKRIIGTGYTNTEAWVDVNSAPTGTWAKTNLTSASWHTMRQANGTLQICNGNTMAMVGFDFSYTNNALQLIPGNLAKTLVERSRYAVIGCDRKDSSEQAGMFLWDQVSTAWNDKKIIPVKGINAMIDTEVPLLQVGTKGAIYYGDMVALLPVTSFPGGGQVYPDAVENDGGVALFGVFGNGSGKTGIYSLGRKKKNAPFALNHEYPLTADEIGSVKKVGTDIFVSYKNGASYGIKKVDTTAKAVATYQGLDLKIPSKLFINGQVPTWEKIVLTTAPLPSGCSIQVHRRPDKNLSTGFLQANLEGGGTAFNTVDATEAVFLIGDKAKILEPQFTLTPSGNNSPEIYKAEIFFT